MNDQFVSTDVYTLLIALGSSAITAGATLVAVRLTTRHTDKAGRADRRLQSYADLLVAAGEVLQAYRRLSEELPSYDQRTADKANGQIADLGARLHRASAVVALTGSELGRREGKALYEIAKMVAGSRVRLHDDDDPDLYPFALIHTLEDKDLEAATETFKAALIPETTALP